MAVFFTYADIGFCSHPPANQSHGIDLHCNALGVSLCPPRQPFQFAPQCRMQAFIPVHRAPSRLMAIRRKLSGVHRLPVAAMLLCFRQARIPPSRSANSPAVRRAKSPSHRKSHRSRLPPCRALCPWRALFPQRFRASCPLLAQTRPVCGVYPNRRPIALRLLPST